MRTFIALLCFCVVSITSSPLAFASIQKSQIHSWQGQTILTFFVEGGRLNGTPTLILSQARFSKVNGKTVPDPATLEILTPSENGWDSELVTDDQAAVFHKAKIWKNGILSISGGIPKSEQQAYLKHWTKTSSGWSAQTLWTGSWEGDKQRLRDFELGDVDGDGEDEIILATHDQGVVVVLEGIVQGRSVEAIELDPKPNTYVHEVEVGDIDGDGQMEFFATPSDPNKRTHTQAGDVVMYRFQNGQYVRTLVDRTEQTHAKEILAADIDGDGITELFSAVEAEKRDSQIIGQVEIRQFHFENGMPKGHQVIATLKDAQLRFMVAHDFDQDGRQEIVLAPMKSGLYLMRFDGQKYTIEQIESDSGGYEHATAVLDLDGDGTYEIYAADDNGKKLVRYEVR